MEEREKVESTAGMEIGDYAPMPPVATRTILIWILVVLLIFAVVWIFEATGVIVKCGMCEQKMFSENAYEFYGKYMCDDCYNEHFKGLLNLAKH